jgi:hypothetical protein
VQANFGMAPDNSQEQKVKYYDGIMVLLEEQIRSFKKLDDTSPREVRLAALGVLVMAQSFAVVSFNANLLEEIAKLHSALIASLRPRLEPASKNKPQRFRIFYAKRMPDLPFPTPDLFLEADYHDLGDFKANGLESVYCPRNDPKHEAFIARCEALSTHMELSVGDVVKDSANHYWLCQMQGWKEVLPL